MFGIKRKSKTRNTNIRSKTKMKSINYAIQNLKWKYAGHMVQQKGDRWKKKVEEWTPYGQKRAVGRPMTRWRDEIEKELGPQWRRVEI